MGQCPKPELSSAFLDPSGCSGLPHTHPLLSYPCPEEEEGQGRPWKWSLWSKEQPEHFPAAQGLSLIPNPHPMRSSLILLCPEGCSHFKALPKLHFMESMSPPSARKADSRTAADGKTNKQTNHRKQTNPPKNPNKNGRENWSFPEHGG